MNAQAATAGLGLLAAACWGGSDFAGGMGARRVPPLLIVAFEQSISFICLLALCLVLRLSPAAPHELLFAALGGFTGSLALVVFYRALSMGAMGLTAALTGLLTALVPVLFSLAQEGLPSWATMAGLAMGLVAIWLITSTPAGFGAGTPPQALLLAAIAGVFFGAQLVSFKLASGGGLIWTMTAARGAGMASILLTLGLAPPKGPRKGFWKTGLVTAVLNLSACFFYLRAAQLGRMDVAALVSSLYPAGTILLAALVLRERPARRQLAGIGLALAAVLLLSA
jgi:drug/metabolite transporter (DMT)-like permease